MLFNSCPKSFHPYRRCITSLSGLPRRARAQAQAKIAAIDAVSPTPLVDTFNRKHDYLRISLTEKCNLRCPHYPRRAITSILMSSSGFYCMPNEGIPLAPSANLLTDDEIVRLASVFVRAGVTKIRLTGGEPTIRKGIVNLTGRLNELRSQGLRSIAMTSNGLVLHRYLPELIQNGLTHVNLSLDTLDPFKFEFITRRRGHAAVLRTLDKALESPGIQSVKLNMVVVRGLNDGEVLDFLELTKDSRLSVRMIEYMPFQSNKWDRKKMVPSHELLDTIRISHPNVVRCSDALNDTARNYRIPGYAGTFGFISSMSDHFCATCNRLRLTSDGQIKVCLFDGKEISLRDEIRGGASDEKILSLINRAVLGKKEKHGGSEDIDNIDVVGNRPMISIGGHAKVTRFLPISSSCIPFSPSHRSYSNKGMLMGLRFYSDRSVQNRLTHLDDQGRANMVDVADKAVTSRTATANGRIYIPLHAYELVAGTDITGTDFASHNDTSTRARQEKSRKKGDTLTVAQLAAIMASKKTPDLIPLCHPIPISKVDVSLKPEIHDDQYSILCQATVRCEGRTGVEMEALTAVSVGLLTVWDMLKAVAGKEMCIGDIFVSHKAGGASGDFTRHP